MDVVRTMSSSAVVSCASLSRSDARNASACTRQPQPPSATGTATRERFDEHSRTKDCLTDKTRTAVGCWLGSYRADGWRQRRPPRRASPSHHRCRRGRSRSRSRRRCRSGSGGGCALRVCGSLLGAPLLRRAALEAGHALRRQRLAAHLRPTLHPSHTPQPLKKSAVNRRQKRERWVVYAPERSRKTAAAAAAVAAAAVAVVAAGPPAAHPRGSPRRS